MSNIETKKHKADAPSGNGHAPAHDVASPHDHLQHQRRTRAAAKKSIVQLNNYERFFASLVLISWLALFAGGILVDTKPYRCVISPSGVQVLADEASTSGPRGLDVCTPEQKTGADMWVPVWPQSWRGAYVLAFSWVAVLLYFLPLNLALVCAAAGALGAFGEKANLQDEETPHNSHDDSNPYVSGLLRGFFVYLFMISGLLLLDDKPFSNPSPGQYIRLAGFLSLFSFIVNYQPYLFTSLIDGAFQRISARRSAVGGGTRATVVTDMGVTATTIIESEKSHTDSNNGAQSNNGTQSNNGHKDTKSAPTPAAEE
jgi:hypothetical protein